MCGFVGILRFDGQTVEAEDIARMRQALIHRGPDGSGIYITPKKGSKKEPKVWAGLGHQRLSIIDLSARARQPMSNEDDSLWTVCNGEIYNYKALRHSLIKKGHRFGSRSDTEVILHLYEELGPKCVDRLRGMFALALWDAGEQTMFLARDRLGQKPLYYYSDPRLFAFASEIRAILQLPGLDLTADNRGIDCYFKYGYILGESTPYERIRKLPPASRMLIRDGKMVAERYWDVPFPEPLSPKAKYLDLIEEFDAIFSEAVRLRLESDVPLGAFLSGGLDSSAVVSKMASESGQKDKTFAIGFSEASYDERSHAKTVADLLQTEHRDYAVNYAIQELLPKMVRHFGEPFADSSAIPTYHLARVTRQHVTVALSGDGGDELLCGYNRYLGRKILAYYLRLPQAFRKGVIEKVLSRFGIGDEYYGESLIRQVKLLIGQARRLEDSPLAVLPQVFDRSLRRKLLGWEADVNGYEGPFDQVLQYSRSGNHLDAISQMMWTDLHTYLPDDILVKVDRMSMAHSLEVRSPFMDHELVEFVARLPIELKLNGFTTKYLLKRTMKNILPDNIIQRRKHGFMVPLAAWFKKELKPLVIEQLLDSEAPFDRMVVEQFLAEHWNGKADHSHRIWVLLMYVLWKNDERSGYVLQT
jgi:asparagine synthase (glutamine-hydrolysing)